MKLELLRLHPFRMRLILKMKAQNMAIIIVFY
jgi:hypothetical protein